MLHEEKIIEIAKTSVVFRFVSSDREKSAGVQQTHTDTCSSQYTMVNRKQKVSVRKLYMKE